MKKLIVLLLMQLSCLWALSNPGKSNTGEMQIFGVVTNENGEPLIGATVSIENSMQGTTTNLDGSFILRRLNPGSYKVIVAYMGYEKYVIDVNLDASKELKIALTPESIMGEEVIVSATRASSRMPIAQSNINREEIKRNHIGVDVPYLLELIPSVVATSESGMGLGNTAFRIRGTDMSRINVTVNGVPLNDSESQGVYWVDLPDFASSVDNIQVQRGVGTSTNGAGAFGATVNFQTTTLAPEPFANFEFAGGSFNSMKTTAKVGTGLINSRFSFEGRYSQVKSDGYIDRGSSDHRSFFITGAWHTPRSILRFNLLHGEEHTGITWEGLPQEYLGTNRTYNVAGKYKDANGVTQFYGDEKDNYWQTHYQLSFSQQLGRKFILNTTIHATSGEGYYEQYKQNKKVAEYGFDPLVVGVTRTDLIRRKWMDNIFYGMTFALNYRKNSLTSVLGGGWNRYDGDHFGRILWTSQNIGIGKDHEWYRNSGVKTDANVYLKSTWQATNRLSAFIDLQLRGIGYELTGPDDDLYRLDQKHSWSFFNPKAGLNLKLTSAQELIVSVGVANREPARADLKEAIKQSPVEYPTSERLVDYELGYNLRSRLLALGMNLFYMDYTDQLVLTGEVNDVGYPLMVNVPESYRAGVELTLNAKPFRWLKWEGALTLSRNKIKDFTEYVDCFNNANDWEPAGQRVTKLGTTNISYSPSVVGSSQLRFEPLRGLGLALVSKYVGRQYFDNSSSSDRMIDAYLVTNLKADYRLALKNTKSVYLEAALNNIFNHEYEANAYVYYRALFASGEAEYKDYRYFPQAGINFMVKIGVEF
jgi:iron complex outermembrane receptor protein